MSSVQPAVLVRAAREGATFRQRFTPATGNLQFLNCGEWTLPPASPSQDCCSPHDETLLFQWEGESRVTVGGHAYALATYDTLYIPRGATYNLASEGGANKDVMLRSGVKPCAFNCASSWPPE